MKDHPIRLSSTSWPPPPASSGNEISKKTGLKRVTVLKDSWRWSCMRSLISLCDGLQPVNLAITICLHALLDFIVRWTTAGESGYHYLFACAPWFHYAMDYSRCVWLSLYVCRAHPQPLCFSGLANAKNRELLATSSQLAMSLGDPLPGKDLVLICCLGSCVEKLPV
jgi:hypothetical protein